MSIHSTMAPELHSAALMADPTLAEPSLSARLGQGAPVGPLELRTSPVARTGKAPGRHRRPAPVSRPGQVGPTRPGALPTPDGTRSRSVRDRLVGLLLFLYGPADIGPLGPPMTPRGWEAAAGVLTPELLTPERPWPRIRVIPVP